MFHVATRKLMGIAFREMVRRRVGRVMASNVALLPPLRRHPARMARPGKGTGHVLGITLGSQIPEDAPDHPGMSRTPRVFAEYAEAPTSTIRIILDRPLWGSGPQGRGFDSLQAHHPFEYKTGAYGG